ncbi:MAG: TonB-dependent receptor [Deltaproteobacteria bacterium]|jgi:iron complex outermembrane receptor protein|nr:TonB-dependent receptor [Deltaproteobacteria bacterium]
MSSARIFPVIAAACFVFTLAFSPPASAQETRDSSLTTIFVQAERDKEELPGGYVYRNAKNGVLGSMDIMDIPFTQFNYTQHTIETFGDPSLPLNMVLVNNPSIRTSNTSPMYTDFSIRGVNANGNNFYFNGVPNLFAQFLTPPNHIIESIDVMAGPNTVLNGSTTSVNGTNGNTAPNGVIAVTTKRATLDPVTKYTQTFSGRGSFGEYVDIGRRFGENAAWGLRLNAQYLEGELAVKDMKKGEKNVFVNFDHIGKNSITNFFAGYFDIDVRGGQRWFEIEAASTDLLPAPDSSTSFDYEGMRKIQHGYIITLNHDQQVTDSVDLFLNAGLTERQGDKYDNWGGSLPLNGNTGVITGQVLHMVERNMNEYVQVGARIKSQFGDFKNNLTVTWDFSGTKNYRTQANTAAISITGSLSTGVTATGPFPVVGAAIPINTEYTQSIIAVDQLEYKQFGLIAALQRRDNKYWAINAAGAISERSFHDAFSPSFALTFKPIDNLLLYASYSQGYTRARTVTGTNYENYGELIKPVKNRQYEVGAKYQREGITATFSYFNVDQRLFMDKYIDGKRYLTPDGTNIYNGLELNVIGDILPNWSVTAGLLYLDAKRDKTENGTYDGMYVTGVAKWSGVFATEVKIGENDTAMGRMQFSGPSYVTNANKVELPAWASFDLGYTHVFRIADKPLSVSVSCFNVFDSDYWIGRGGSNVIGLSMPRSFLLSAKIEL